MADKINWNFVAQVAQGPSISGAGAWDGVTYEYHDFTMPPKTGSSGTTHGVSLSGTGTISLVIINCLTPGANVTYAAAAGVFAPDSTVTPPFLGVHMDGPQVFIGNVAGVLLGAAAASPLTFTNNTGTEVEIQMFVGRKT